MSTDSAPDSACAPSCFARPSGPLPSSHYKRRCGSRQAKIVHHALWSCAPPMAGDAAGDEKASPFVRAFVDAVDATMRAHQPHHALAVTQQTWLAFGLTAVLVTTAMCWARFARASLGT